MTNKDLYREFGNIDPDMVEAAAPAQKIKNKKILSIVLEDLEKVDKAPQLSL